MVFKQKLDESRRAAPFKAQVVAKGLFHKEGIDHYETFCPVAILGVLLFLVVKHISQGWQVHHANNSTAFLDRYIE